MMISYNPKTLNSINSVGYMITRMCNASCLHCGSKSITKPVEKNFHKTFKSIFPFLLNHGIKQICFTGGEPFIVLSELKNIMKTAQYYGLTASVYTNGYWATEIEKSIQLLNTLKFSGLESIILSTDRFHTKYIKKERIIIASKAAKASQINCQINVNLTNNDWEGLNLYSFMLKYSNVKVNMLKVHPIGRGEYLSKSCFKYLPLRIEKCNYVGLIEIDHKGIVYSCPTSSDFCPRAPLVLGNILTEKLDEIFMKFKSSVFHYILSNFGPEGILNILNKFEEIKNKINIENFNHRCHLCKYINNHYYKTLQKFEEIGIEILTQKFI